MKLEIIFENSDIVAVNKSAGLLVHGIYDKYGPRHSEKTLVDYVAEKYPEILEVGDPGAFLTIEGKQVNTRPGVVHRLDRETSGVIVLARKQKAFDFLKEQFKNQKVHKTYQALVWGRVQNKKGLINKPISIKNGTVKRSTHGGRMTREAITEYELQQYLTDSEHDFSYLLVTPKTGRTHQIRVHLNSIHHPVYGDKLYGKRADIFNLDRHFLHAVSLELTLGGETLKLKAPLAKELKDVLNQLTSADAKE